MTICIYTYILNTEYNIHFECIFNIGTIKLKKTIKV